MELKVTKRIAYEYNGGVDIAAICCDTVTTKKYEMNESMDESYTHRAFTKEFASVLKGRAVGDIKDYLKRIKTVEDLRDFCHIVYYTQYPKVWYDNDIKVAFTVCDGVMHLEFHTEDTVRYSSHETDLIEIEMLLIGFTSILE